MEQAGLENLVLDNREDGLFRVHRSAFTDPQIMALEQRRVFEQCWLYAGHTSEIPQPGDFKARRVAGGGGLSVGIFVRRHRESLLSGSISIFAPPRFGSLMPMESRQEL